MEDFSKLEKELQPHIYKMADILSKGDEITTADFTEIAEIRNQVVDTMNKKGVSDTDSVTIYQKMVETAQQRLIDKSPEIGESASVMAKIAANYVSNISKLEDSGLLDVSEGNKMGQTLAPMITRGSTQIKR